MPRKMRIYGASKLDYRHVWQAVRQLNHDEFELVSRWIDWNDNDRERLHDLFDTIIPEDLARADALIAYLPDPSDHLKGTQHEIGAIFYGDRPRPVVIVSPLPLVMYRSPLGEVIHSKRLMHAESIDKALTMLKQHLREHLK